jgi:hypothetical protein
LLHLSQATVVQRLELSIMLTERTATLGRAPGQWVREVMVNERANGVVVFRVHGEQTRNTHEGEGK